MATTHAFMCYIEEDNAVHGVICSHYIEHAWYSDLGSRSIKLIFDIGSSLSMRYLAFAITSNNYEWEVLHVCDSQNNAEASVTIPSTYDGTVKFGVKLYDSQPSVGSVLNVGFDYVITGGIDVSTASSNTKTVTMSCATADATIKYTLDGTDPTEESTEYIEQIEVEPPMIIKARGYKNNVLDSDVATLILEPQIPLDTPVLSIGAKSGDSFYVMLDNVSSYPDDATVYYSYESNDPLGNGESMKISDIKNGVGGVIGAIALVSLALSTLFVAVSCDGYVDSPTGEITLKELPTPECSFSRISSSQGRVTISNYNEYPSGTSLVINGSTYAMTNTVNLSIGTSVTSVSVYALYDGEDSYMTQSSTMSGTIPAYVPTVATPSISFNSSTNTVTITCSTSSATIYYRVGTSGSYSRYTGSFTISSSTYVYAYATRSGYNTSGTTSRYCTYTIPTLPTPQLSYSFNSGVLMIEISNTASFENIEPQFTFELTRNGNLVQLGNMFGISFGKENPITVTEKNTETGKYYATFLGKDNLFTDASYFEGCTVSVTVEKSGYTSSHISTTIPNL